MGRAEIDEANEADVAGRVVREAFVHALAAMLQDVGHRLWVGGAIVGPDRKSGESPFGYGNDRVVGLATVTQAAGQLTSGVAALLTSGNLYGAAALLRQVVETEYLMWAFAADPDETALWLRSTKKERDKFWSPRRLRERSGGRFLSKDYGLHCGMGGHPSPEGAGLLPGRAGLPGPGWWWLDLALHGESMWQYLPPAIAQLDAEDAVLDSEAGLDFIGALDEWRQRDPLIEFYRSRARTGSGSD